MKKFLLIFAIIAIAACAVVKFKDARNIDNNVVTPEMAGESAYTPFDWIDTDPITITDGVISDARLVEFGNYCFTNRSDITTISCPNVIFVGENAFKNCKNLRTIDLPKAIEINPSAFENCTNLVTVNLPSLLEAGNSMFRNCNKLKTVNLASVETIGKNAFRDALDHVGMDTFTVSSNLISIGYEAFRNSGLTNFISESVENISAKAFHGCKDLQYVRMGNSNSWEKVSTMNDNEYYMTSWFGRNSGEQDERIPWVGAQFAKCTSLKTVDLPKTRVIVPFMFYGDENLDEVNIPNAITLDDAAFYLAGSLDGMYCPAAISMGRLTFAGCSMTNFTIPRNVTNVRFNTFSYMGKSAYHTNAVQDCVLLENLYVDAQQLSSVIPDLSRCTSLKHIFVNKPLSDVRVAIPKWNIPTGHGIIIQCPDGSIAM